MPRKNKKPAPAAELATPPPPTTEIPADLLTPDEAGKLLRVSGSSVRRWVADGKLPAYRAGTKIRIAREDVVAFLKRAKPEKGPMPRTVAELRAEDEETERILQEFGVRRPKKEQ